MKTLILLLFPIAIYAQPVEHRGIDYTNMERDTVVTRVVPVNFADTILTVINAEEAAALFRELGVDWRKELRGMYNAIVRSRLLEVKSQVLATEIDEPRTGTKTAIRDARSEAIRTIQKRATIGTAAATGNRP